MGGDRFEYGLDLWRGKRGDGLVAERGSQVFANDKLRLAVRFLGPFRTFEVEPALSYEMKGAFGRAFAAGGFGPAMLDRIDAFAYKTACGSGRPSRIGECDIGVGTEAEEVLLARTQPSIAEQSGFAPVRPDAQGQAIPIREQIGVLARIGERNTTSEFGSTRLGMA